MWARTSAIFAKKRRFFSYISVKNHRYSNNIYIFRWRKSRRIRWWHAEARKVPVPPQTCPKNRFLEVFLRFLEVIILVIFVKIFVILIISIDIYIFLLYTCIFTFKIFFKLAVLWCKKVDKVRPFYFVKNRGYWSKFTKFFIKIFQSPTF